MKWLKKVTDWFAERIRGFLHQIREAYEDARDKEEDEAHIQGRQLIRYERAWRRSRRLLKSGDEGIFWGAIYIPDEYVPLNFLAISSVGRGKTIQIQFAMQSYLPRITPGSDHRAIVYNPKQDFRARISGMGAYCPLHEMNPTDRRSVAWWMAKDCNTPARIRQLGTHIIPANKGPNSFFDDTARESFIGTCTSFSESAPENWTLRDIILACREKQWLEHIWSRCPATKHLTQYMGDERVWHSIHSTLQSHLEKYATIAACWDHTVSKLSLRDWVEEESILLLGAQESIRTELDTLNGLLLSIAKDLLLEQPESSTRRTGLFLDELRNLKDVHSALTPCLTRGRDRGIFTVAAYQAHEGLQHSLGSKELADEIAGQCYHILTGGTNSPTTAEFLSNVFGDQKRHVIKRSYTKTSGIGNTQTSTNEQPDTETEPVLLSSDFQAMDHPSPQTGMHLYCISPVAGAYYVHLRGDWIDANLCRPDPNVENYLPRPVEHQHLRPWEDADLRRLDLKPQSPSIRAPLPNIKFRQNSQC